MSDIIHSQTTPELAARAAEVRVKLHQIKNSIEDNFFDLCDLLTEAKDNDFHLQWGFARFGDWVEQGSDLDLSERQAYYYINIAKKVKALGLTRPEIKAAKISKLKEIFSLDPSTHGEQMKQLVAAAATESLEDIKSKVSKSKAQAGDPEYRHMTIKISELAKEMVDEAFELARMNYGSTVQHGEITEISDGQCLELISVSYLQDPNNHPENNTVEPTYEEIPQEETE